VYKEAPQEERQKLCRCFAAFVGHLNGSVRISC